MKKDVLDNKIEKKTEKMRSACYGVMFLKTTTRVKKEEKRNEKYNNLVENSTFHNFSFRGVL